MLRWTEEIGSHHVALHWYWRIGTNICLHIIMHNTHVTCRKRALELGGNLLGSKGKPYCRYFVLHLFWSFWDGLTDLFISHIWKWDYTHLKLDITTCTCHSILTTDHSAIAETYKRPSRKIDLAIGIFGFLVVPITTYLIIIYKA